MLIDTHCHLNDQEAFPDPSGALARARSAGVGAVMIVGVDLESSKRALDLAEASEGVYAIIGCHPNYASSYTRASLAEFKALLGHPKAVALGEIGLDFHWTYASREEQQRALLDQLDLAADLNYPVVFHCREAYPALLEVLEARPPRPYLFHCFSGSSEDSIRGAQLGAYFGIDGPITYKKASSLRDIVRSLDRSRIVIETDSPYLTPEPFRGKPNEPAYVRYVNGALASVLGISYEESANLTSSNAKRFFRLPERTPIVSEKCRSARPRPLHGLPSRPPPWHDLLPGSD